MAHCIMQDNLAGNWSDWLDWFEIYQYSINQITPYLKMSSFLPFLPTKVNSCRYTSIFLVAGDTTIRCNSITGSLASFRRQRRSTDTYVLYARMNQSINQSSIGNSVISRYFVFVVCSRRLSQSNETIDSKLLIVANCSLWLFCWQGIAVIW